MKHKPAKEPPPYTPVIRGKVAFRQIGHTPDGHAIINIEAFNFNDKPETPGLSLRITECNNEIVLSTYGVKELIAHLRNWQEETERAIPNATPAIEAAQKIVQHLEKVDQKLYTPLRNAGADGPWRKNYQELQMARTLLNSLKREAGIPLKKKAKTK